MMTNFFSAEHEQFRQKARAFIDQQLRPRSTAWEHGGEFPRSVLLECAQQGLFQSDPWRNGIVAEELPRCESLGFALSFLVQSNLIIPLLEDFGTDEQKATYVSAVSSGKMMGAMAVTEPASGSDFAALQCRADISGDNLILHGEKTYITNAAFADFLIVAARIPELTEEGLTLILVSTQSDGVTIERVRTLGLSASGTGRIRFDGCVVKRGQVLGSAGEGFGQVQRALNRERLFGGLACVAWADYAMQKTLAFARERSVFGNTINQFQVIRHEFADMATQLEAARSLNYLTFSRWIAGESVTRQICMIKLFSYQVAQQVITQCLQIHGGLGYMDDHWTSRFYRDARALTIAAGTPEVIREMIAAFMRV
ncbi:MAG: acyl-CoA dehydrogenase family protein [Candidatus Sulfotelmatobacter sp.]